MLTPPPPSCDVHKDAWGWAVGRGSAHVHAMCVLVLHGGVTGPGAAVCWQHPVHMDIMSLVGLPPCKAEHRTDGLQ